jgi:uncharacterized protein
LVRELMKIELDLLDSSIYTIKSYSNSGVFIKNTLYETNIIVSPKIIVEDWGPANINNLDQDHLIDIFNTKPELVLIGTGSKLLFPHNDILDAILLKNIGVEVMDTGAACRAYNFIAGEGRIVTAALFHPGI